MLLTNAYLTVMGGVLLEVFCRQSDFLSICKASKMIVVMHH